MKILKYISFLVAFFASVGCNEDHSLQPSRSEESEDKITLDVSLQIAQIEPAHTRAFSDKPEYGNLKLYVLEFELNSEDPFDNNITKNYTESDAIAEEAVNGDDGDVHFNITLDKEDQPRVLHFIAVPKDTELNISAFNEGALIPGLAVDGSTPAYWNRIEFPDGYGSYDSDGNWQNDEDLEKTLQHVPMLCNFSKISLSVDAGTGFILDGFALVNQPTKGSVAPWNSTTMRFPEFLVGGVLKDYAAISESYDGYWPFNQVDDMTDKIPTAGMFTADAKYLYEHPHTSLYSPLIILQGHRTGGVSMYYKLDLGKPDNSSLFQFYNLLRNFEYAITVTKIDANGYDTAEEALAGVVFNNFSFDVNTRQMLNVSNGEDMLWVNKTTIVVTSEDETVQTFSYKYMKNIGNGGGTVATGEVEFKNLVADPEDGVITGVSYGEIGADGWRDVTITTVAPTATRKEQSFIAYYPKSGLGRTVSIVVRTPWLYTNAGVWGGNYNYYDQFIQNVAAREEWKGYVSSNDTLGRPLTVRFHIPDDIPETLFPMTFTFESSRQNIENNKVGNLLVEYGPGYFNESQRTIKYTKTVTWANYNSALTKDDEQGTIVDDDKDGITSHVVRARFQTILPIVTDQETLIRIYNPYMRVQGSDSKYLEVSFRGKTGTAPNYE